nr:hypothetical protein 16 [bacterium]
MIADIPALIATTGADVNTAVLVAILASIKGLRRDVRHIEKRVDKLERKVF